MGGRKGTTQMTDDLIEDGQSLLLLLNFFLLESSALTCHSLIFLLHLGIVESIPAQF